MLPDTHAGQPPDRTRDYKQAFRVGVFVVDPGALALRCDGQVARLKPKAMAVLLELAREPGVTVTRDELLDRVWGSTFISPGVVGHAITALRRAFAGVPDGAAYIETIPRIGYRLLAPVEREDREGAEDASSPADAAHTAPASAGDGGPAPSARKADVPGHPAGGRPDAGLGAAQGPGAAAAAPPGTGATPDGSGAVHALPADPPAGGAEAGSARPGRRDRARRRAAVAIIASVLLGLGVVAWLQRAPVQAPRVDDIRRVTFDPGSENTPRLNAAGDWLVYSRTPASGGHPELILQSVYGTDAIRLTEGDSAERPTWSPQGRRVAYLSRKDGQCALRIVEIDSRRRQDVAPCAPNSTVYLDWNPADAGQIAYTAVGPTLAGGSRLQLLRERGSWSAEAFEYERMADSVDLDPRFSPRGNRIAFRRGSNPASDLYLVAATGGKVTRLTRLRSTIGGLTWLPDGSGLVFASDHAGSTALYLLRLSDGAIAPLGVSDAAAPHIAGSHMTYQLQDWRSSLVEVALDTGMPPRVLTSSSGRDEAAAVAPDGSRVVFASDRDGSSQLWSLDRATGDVQRLTRHEGVRVDLPAMSPDGSRVIHVARAAGTHELWEHRFSDGANRRVMTLPASVRNVVYAADGRSLWYVAWQGDEMALHACARARGQVRCEGRSTGLAALHVERADVDGAGLLVLESPAADGGVHLVTEDGLRPVRHVPLPPSHAWTVVDDAIWSLHREDAGLGIDLSRTSLRDGSSRQLARFPDLRTLGLAAFRVTPDGRHLILPTITENRTDIAVARLAPRVDD